MADPPGFRRAGEDATQYWRRRNRRDYLTEYEHERRARAKAKGARRVDVTLNAKALDDYATVRRYIEGLNRFASERKLLGFPIRLSDSEIIKIALDRAAASICEDDNQAAKTGGRRLLDE